MSLRKKTISGVVWTLIQQVSVQGVNFFVQLLLARILLPEAFGLIALLQIFLMVGQALTDGGMTSSLIRTKEPDQIDYSTVFFMNLIASIIIYLIIFVCAPSISDFFHLPELTLIIRVYTIAFVIQAFVGVHTARLTKDMNFKLQMLMQLPATILGGIAGLIMAYNGLGVWSLVWMYLITSFTFMLQHWFRTDWRPRLIVDIKKMKYHFQFGYKLTLSSILTSVYNNLYVVVIGKFFSISQLAYFNQANTLRMFPVQNLTVALQKVTYPVFSSLQSDDRHLKSVFQRITLMVFYVVCPIMIYLFLVAEPLFKLVLTEKWLPAVPYFQILSICAIVYPLSIYNLNIVLAKGRSGLHFKLEIIKKVGSSIFLLLIVPFGIYGVVYAAALSMLIHAFVNCYVSGKLIGYEWWEQLKNVTPIIIMTTVSAAITYLCNEFVFRVSGVYNDVVYISVDFVLFFFVYLMLSLIFRMSSFIEIKSMIRQIKQSTN